MVTGYLKRWAPVFMLICVLIFASAFFNHEAAAAEYKNGWNYKNFYAAVQTCRDSIVYQTAQGYEKKGISAGQTSESLRNDIISMTPVLDHIARTSCFCAINEIAKKHTFQEFAAGVDVKKVRQTDQCSSAVISVLKTFKKDPEAEKLQ